MPIIYHFWQEYWREHHSYFYNALYLEKYSYNNPQFNERFLELVLKNNALQILALRKDGRIDRVIGFYEITTKRGIILHQSSGAASFKRFRGFVGTIEYSAVFYQHLPFWRQLVWRLLGLLVNKLAVSLMQKYKL